MKLEYLHRSGGTVLSAPSGASYDFAENAEGRRIANVKDPVDVAWFLRQTNQVGETLFQAVGKPVAPEPLKLDEASKLETQEPPAVPAAPTADATDPDA